MQAMILAAGLGTRLLPHTRLRPKPLFPILNTPLLLLTIKRLKNYGFDHLVVNCHHLKEQIVAILQGVEGVVVQEEEIVLGTGGGLKKALPLFRDEPLLVTNGDIYHTVNLQEFYRYHQKSGSRLTLAMHHHPRFNTVETVDEKIRAFTGKSGPGRLAFTGLHVVEPELLATIGDDSYSCIVDHYRALLLREVEINAFRVDGSYWTDMGTEEDYLELHGHLLTGQVPCWQEIGPVRKPFCIAGRAKLPADVELCDWAAIGDSHIENNCRLERVVVWDEVFISTGKKLADQLLSEDPL